MIVSANYEVRKGMRKVRSIPLTERSVKGDGALPTVGPDQIERKQVEGGVSESWPTSQFEVALYKYQAGYY